MSDERARVRALYAQAVAEGRPTAWFEELYQAAGRGEASIPWADNAANPWMTAWIDRSHLQRTGRKALVVGCGYGDDAVALVERGFDVTAFDIAPTAVETARKRCEGVQWVVADAASPPAAWLGAFDLIIEIYTLQAVPPEIRASIAQALPTCLAPGGRLLVIARYAVGADPAADGPPWPLTKDEVRRIATDDVTIEEFEPFQDDVPRVLAVFVKHMD